MARPIVFALLLLLLAMPLTAQESLPPIEQGFPRDCLAYLEVDLQGDLAPLLHSLPTWEERGAVGLGYQNLAALLAEIGLMGDGEMIQKIVEGAEKIAFGLVNVTTDGADTLTAIQHRSAREVIKLFEANTKDGNVIFEKNPSNEDIETWTLQFPKDWFDFGFSMRWGWGGAQVREYTDPLTVGIYKDRVLFIGNRESHVLDGISLLEYSDETQDSLQGSSSFREARKSRQGEDLFGYWSIAGTIRMVDRIPDNQMPTGEFRMLVYIYKSLAVDRLLELKQFSYAAVYTDYDAKAGTLATRAQVRYFNRPSWLSILHENPKPAPPLEYVPEHALELTAISIGSAKELYTKLTELIERKAQALGDPDMAQGFRQMFGNDETFLGMRADQFVDMIGSDHISLSVPDYDNQGIAIGAAMPVAIFTVLDEAAFRKVVEENLRNHEDPTTRERFFRTAEQRIVRFKDGTFKAINTFNELTGTSAAWVIDDSKFIYGAVDAVEACLRARYEGSNLLASKTFQEHIAKNPIAGHIWSYTDMGESFASVLAHSAQEYLEEDRAQTLVERLLHHQALARNRIIEPAPSAAVARSLAGFLGSMVSSSTIEITGDAIVMNATVSGLPSIDDVAQIAVILKKQANNEEAGQRLREEVFPAVDAFLFREGRLPKTIEELSGGKATGRAVMRDPNLAGASELSPADDKCFVWLGDWDGRAIVNALPLAYTREPGLFGVYWVLMSDHSTHRVTKEHLDGILAFAKDKPGEASDYGSLRPQTLKDARPDLRSAFKLN